MLTYLSKRNKQDNDEHTQKNKLPAHIYLEAQQIMFFAFVWL